MSVASTTKPPSSQSRNGSFRESQNVVQLSQQPRAQSAAALLNVDGLTGITNALKTKGGRQRHDEDEEEKESNGDDAVSGLRASCLVTTDDRVFFRELDTYLSTDKAKQVLWNPFFTYHQKVDGGAGRFVPSLETGIRFWFHHADLAPVNDKVWWAYYPPTKEEVDSEGEDVSEGGEAATVATTANDDDEEEGNSAGRTDNRVVTVLPREHDDTEYFNDNGFPRVCRHFNRTGDWVTALLTADAPWVSAFPHPTLRVMETFEFEWNVVLGGSRGVMSTAEYEQVFSGTEQGKLSITLPAHQLRQLMNDDGTTHIVPYAIWMVGETNTLPLPMAAQIVTKDDMGRDVTWFTPVVPNPDIEEKTTPVLGHLVLPGTDQHMPYKMMYKPDARRVGHPDFQRWAGVDFRALDVLMKTGKFKSVDLPSRAYSIPAPEATATHTSNIPQFVCMDEWLLLKRNSKIRQYKGNMAVDLVPNDETGLYSFRVPKVLFNELVDQRRHLVDRDNTLMRVDQDWKFELSLLSTARDRVITHYKKFYDSLPYTTSTSQWYTNVNKPSNKDEQRVTNGSKPLSKEDDYTVKYSCLLRVFFAKVPRN